MISIYILYFEKSGLLTSFLTFPSTLLKQMSSFLLALANIGKLEQLTERRNNSPQVITNITNKLPRKDS